MSLFEIMSKILQVASEEHVATKPLPRSIMRQIAF